MMVSHFEQLVRQEGMTWGTEAAKKKEHDRFDH
jgi:hypothetical protein